MSRLLLFAAIVLLPLAGCQDDAMISSAIDDSAIADQVKTAFINDEALRALAIEVDARDGVVQLTGTVNTELDIVRANSVAEAVQGVRSVNNALVVDGVNAER